MKTFPIIHNRSMPNVTGTDENLKRMQNHFLQKQILRRHYRCLFIVEQFFMGTGRLP